MFLRELCILTVIFTFSKFGEPCQTPKGQTGDCIPITECSSLKTLLEHSLPEKGTYLRQHHCGFLRQIPKVCCPIEDTLLRSETCGRDTQRRIYGGEKTVLDEFPWMALLQYELSSGKKYFDCGGALINERYVLTAAHCIKSNLKSVRLGEYNITTEIDCQIPPYGEEECAPKYIDVPIEEKIIHENYVSDDINQYDDIALIRLKKKVTFSDYIKPICLPSTNEELIEKNLDVAGWGLTEHKNISTAKLKVKVPVRENGECEKTFRNFNYNLTMKSTQICVGGEKGKDSCKGDSGGPLMDLRKEKNKDPKWYVEGIVSFGATPCGMKNWPGVYTRTFEYVTWIISKIKP